MSVPIIFCPGIQGIVSGGACKHQVYRATPRLAASLYDYGQHSVAPPIHGCGDGSRAGVFDPWFVKKVPIDTCSTKNFGRVDLMVHAGIGRPPQHVREAVEDVDL